MNSRGGESALGRPVKPGLGVLAHITSLPASGAGRPGTLGAPARAFVDWLADAGVRYWQILPLNPVNEHGSPYAGISAFAGNTRLLEAGSSAPGASGTPSLPDPSDDGGYDAFCEREADWLEPFAAFAARRESGSSLRRLVEEQRRLQFAFERQWNDLRAYANARGIQVIGDMPLYVGPGSADVQTHPELFQLGPGGKPKVVAGCPPDAFAPEGQVWNNPVYNWDALRAEGYTWWLRRLERTFALYDLVRLDHFIGFARYFAIPADAPARCGEYRPGPGIELFETAREKLGPLPVIAEDLGNVTDEVRKLVAACGFPGMDVLQFADDPLAGYAPDAGKIVYTGTHDNQTLVGYCRARYPGLDAHATAEQLMEATAASPARVCMLPLQDLIGLGDEARMNTPGTEQGNWAWQAQEGDLERAFDTAARLAALHRERHGDSSNA